jgi:hypothetical protein
MGRDRAHPVMGAETVIRMKEWGELSTRMVSAPSIIEV